LKLALSAVLFAAGVQPAFAADDANWRPDRVVRLISPSPPGGGTDAVSRAVATKLGELTKWQVIVENKPGSGNNIGLEIGAKSPGDGHVMVMGESSNLAINPYLYKRLSFDPVKDLAPVALVGTGALVLVVRAESKVDSLASLVAESKNRQLTYASSGNGTVGHLTSESVRTLTGANFLHVPYKGAGPAMQDMLGGQVDFYFSSLTAALPLIQAQKLKALAVTSGERIKALPGVPTLVELGHRGAEFYVFYGVVVPASTPKPVIAVLNREINRALTSADVSANLYERGIDVKTGDAGFFQSFLDGERRKWAATVKASGATVD